MMTLPSVTPLRLKIFLPLLLGSLGLTGSLPANSPVERFHELSSELSQQGIEQASAGDLLRLHQLSREAGTPVQANNLLSRYLTGGGSPTPELLLAAARSARLAGDYPLATSRYKAFLAEGVGRGSQAAEGALELYRLLLEIVGDEDDAFQFIVNNGDRLRGHPSLLKYDLWALQRAMDQNRFPEAGRLLARVLAEEIPLEQERTYFWPHLDNLLPQVSRGGENHLPGRPHYQRISERVRDDLRQGLWALASHHLRYQSALQMGDSERVQKEYFSQVLNAARQAFRADPTGTNLVRVTQFLMGGEDRQHRSVWEHLAADREAFFAEAWEQLSNRERTVFLQWQADRAGFANLVARPNQWSQWLRNHGDAFSAAGHSALAAINFGPGEINRNHLRRKAQLLEGVPSVSAAAIRSLAENTDLRSAVTFLGGRESSHLPHSGTFVYLQEELWPAYQEATGQQEENYWHQVVVAYGQAAYGNGPAGLYDNRGVTTYLQSAWELGGTYDQEAFLNALQTIRWISFIANRQDNDVFNRSGILRNVSRWGSELRNLIDKEDAEARSALDQFTAIEDLLRDIRENEPQENWRHAPSDDLQLIARARVAAEERDPNAFQEHFLRLIPRIHRYGDGGSPFERAMFEEMTRPFNNRSMLPAQTELLKTMLETYRGDREDSIHDGLEYLYRVMGRSGGWRDQWDRIGRDDREISLRINDLFAATLLREIDQGRFSPAIFERFRRSRDGHGWAERGVNLAVMEAMIESRILFKVNFPANPQASTTLYYMDRVRTDFEPLQEKYPLASWFDDWYAEEIRDNGWINWSYRQMGGQDQNGTVAKAILDTLLKWEKLPLGLAGEAPSYSLDAIHGFHNWVLRDGGRRDLMRLAGFLTEHAGQTRFDPHALGRFWFELMPVRPNTDPGRDEIMTRLQTYLNWALASPERLGPPSLDWLEQTGEATLQFSGLRSADYRLLQRAVNEMQVADWNAVSGRNHLIRTLVNHLNTTDRHPDLIEVIPNLWVIQSARRDGSIENLLVNLAEDALEQNNYELATVVSVHGLEIARGNLSNDARNRLTAIRSQAVVRIGGMIPVEPSDPRFPLYEAQIAYLSASPENAWRTYLEHQDRLIPMLQDLNPDFLIWLITEHTRREQFTEAESLVQEMLPWLDEVREAISPEIRGRLLLAQANISYADREFPTARAQFERIVNADEFDHTRVQEDARLMVAEVDRVTRQYDQAIDSLQRMTRRGSNYQRTQAHYQLARIYFDQEEYTQADRELGRVFAFQRNHPDALLLQGEINIRARRLQEATDIAIGIEAAQEIVVPGRPLRIHLEDANLAVVGAEESLEVRVWTSSGDEEIVNLLPSGNNRTRFEVQIPTRLGAVTPGDGVLQIFGQDEIRYDFTEAFRARRNLPAGEPPVLRVASNAELSVSSGEILSSEEQARRRLEQMIRERRGDRRTEEGAIARSEVRRADQIKPGNPINIRVADPDRSISPQRDTIAVNASTTSGDRVSGFVLTETEPHSGVFTGSIPTASAPATAFASDSDEGRQPNSVISAGNHQPWLARRDNVRPKVFGVDLNDNLILGKLAVTASEPGRAIRAFRVDTSLNNRDFQTVGQWPRGIDDWNGQPRVHLARVADQVSLRRLADIQSYLDMGSIRHNRSRVTVIPENFRGDFRAIARENRGPADLERDFRPYVAHAEMNLFIPQRQSRTLRLVTNQDHPDTAFFLLINGRSISPVEGEFQFTQSFRQGVHRVEVYVLSRRDDQASFDLQWNIEEPPYFASIPETFFSPQSHPQIQLQAGIEAAHIEVSDDGQNFNVAFQGSTQARVVRLVIEDFEGDAPAINRWTLSDSQGNRILPLDRDLTRLHEENNLYIIPGDRISVTYTDPVTLSRDREVHEAFLQATYHNATIQPAFSQYREDGEETLFTMRRYQLGDAVNVVITDPDQDVSDRKDTVTFTVRNALGDSISLEALETGPHSGVFIGRFFPVAGEPQRASEIRVREGDDLTLVYRDETNTDPGIPWDRTAVIEQAFYMDPELRIYRMESFADLPEDGIPLRQSLEEGQREYFPTEKSLLAERPLFPETEAVTSYLEAPLLAEILFPSITFSPRSRTVLYAQTSRGREAHREALKIEIRNSLQNSTDLRGDALDEAVTAALTERLEEGFDIRVPGTIRLEQTPSGASRFPAPHGFRQIIVRGDPDALSPLDDGRYTFTIPLELGALPKHSPAFQQEQEGPESVTNQPPAALAVNGEDRIYVGFRFTDDRGERHWLTAEAQLTSAPYFHVMDRRYREIQEVRHVGERLYFRVVDKARRVGDSPEVEIVADIGNGRRTATFSFREELPHSGIFKTVATLVHEDDQTERPGENVVRLRYGESVTFRYTGRNGEVIERTVRTHRGADGSVIPFTKRFDDPERAVHTMFMMAEAHFELAKRQRDLGHDSLARRQIQQGRRLLDEAMRDFPESENQAQAEYLLGNLALEFGEMAENDQIRQRHFLEAISRFTDIVAKYPESTYAPQAQFKKALTFERMGELDRASEEYVRLSYRYPDNELVAETIARLGQYFLGVGRSFNERADAEEDPVEAEIIRAQGREMFRTAAEVFGRLSERFPNHQLAGRTLVLSGQCYLRATDYAEAVGVLQQVVDDSSQLPGVRAEAAYWCAEAYVRNNDLQNAFRMFKRLTWDFPETEWARYARGRLTEPQFAGMDG